MFSDVTTVSGNSILPWLDEIPSRTSFESGNTNP